MATLTKLEPVYKKEGYEITISCSIDTQNMAETYYEKSPEKDRVTKLLVFAHKNHWDLRGGDFDFSDNVSFLMEKAETFLTEDELLEVDAKRLKANIVDFSDDMTFMIPSYIEKITIMKDGYQYKLDVTDDDMREIFLELAELE